MELDPTTSIPAFYAGRSILITGATGFMGKVLIEKLLRSCPDIAEIFLLMRNKKGMSIDDRLKKMLTLPIFDRLREENPGTLKKLIPVIGDVAEKGLGLPTIERRVLIEKVSIVFHVAASVRFDESFKQAVFMNTRGTREVCELAASMKKLVVFLHVSTTYGNTDRPVVDEVLYPAHADWKKTIKIAETLDEHILDMMTAKYIDKLPNTYTFTKQLAEHVVNHYGEVIPSVIIRPSVVISSIHEPMPGWLDNFNGPVGLLIGGGKGILRTVYGDPNVNTDYIPVDVAIKNIIISAWQRGIKTIAQDPEVHLYNCSSNSMKTMRIGDLIKIGFNNLTELPLDGILWYPNTSMCTIQSIYYLNFLVLQLLPAYIIDVFLKLGGAKPRLVKLQRKIYTANVALGHFLTRDWKFINTKCLGLLDTVSVVDQAIFSYEIFTFDTHAYFKTSMIGAKKYLLNEDMNKLDEAKAHYNKMWWLDRISKAWLSVFITWAGVASGLFPRVLSGIGSVLDISLTA